MSWQRIKALTIYYLYTIKRNYSRIILIIFWPVFDLMIWGFTTLYIQKSQSVFREQNLLLLFLGTFIFWNLILKAQQEIPSQFNEDVYSRNLTNFLITPLTSYEIIFALILSSLIKIFIITSLLLISAYILYSLKILAFNLLIFIPVINFLIFGWSLGILVIALVLRFGNRLEFLSWALAIFIQPFSCVFYPRSTLPSFFQFLSWFIPSSYSFEAIRKIYLGHNNTNFSSLSSNLTLGSIVTLFYLIFSVIFYNYMFTVAKKKGSLSKL